MDRREFFGFVPLGALATGSVNFSARASCGTSASVTADNIERYRQAKFGVFVHVVPEITISADGNPVIDIDELVDHFDVERFASTVASFKPDYLAFTAWHFRCRPLYPSDVNARWRSGKSSARRDLVGEILEAMGRYGIPVILYTHPRDGHDFSEADMISTGWGAGGAITSPDPNPDTFKFDTWNRYISELYHELMQRYGASLLGIYLDEGSGRADSYKVVDYYLLRRIIKKQCPENQPVMIHNWAGNLYSADVGNKEYYYLDQFSDFSGKSWPANEHLGVSPVVGSVWYATKDPGAWSVKFSPEALYRYTVLQASANFSGGGVAWSAGPYANGKAWESGVEDLLRRTGQYVARWRTAISGTLPSLAYPTRDKQSFDELQWGVACESFDRRTIFLHILKPPSGRVLRLGLPANGIRIAGASELLSESKIGVVQSADGVVLELPKNLQWDPLDTVIRVSVG